MGPFDPRLIRHASATQNFLVISGFIGLTNALCLVIQATLLASLIADVFLHGASLDACIPRTLWLFAAFAGRALCNWLQELLATRTNHRVKSQLRNSTIQRLTELGPEWISRRNSSELLNLLTTGLDTLDAYFVRYLPQVFLSAIVPISVGGYIAIHDWLSGLILMLTIPLVPFFMILVGLFTEKYVNEQWQVLNQISRIYLDLIRGLPTLKAFNRGRSQISVVEETGENFRKATIKVLRISFLSALILDLVSTLAVALVAVSIGLRLVKGNFDFYDSLLVLMLAPEVYSPLRQLGVHFHAAKEGTQAISEILAILESHKPASGTQVISNPHRIHIDGVDFSYGNANILESADFTFESSDFNVITGPSGSGKTTLVNLVLGLSEPHSGAVRIDGEDLRALNVSQWRTQVGYLAQRPWLPNGTIRNALNFGTDSSDDELLELGDQIGLNLRKSHDLPDGLDTTFTSTSGLSTGQRRRVALMRALISKSPVLILDEPTATLDSEHETVILELLRKKVRQGVFVIVVSHRPQVINGADHLVTLETVNR